MVFTGSLVMKLIWYQRDRPTSNARKLSFISTKKGLRGTVTPTKMRRAKKKKWIRCNCKHGATGFHLLPAHLFH